MTSIRPSISHFVTGQTETNADRDYTQYKGTLRTNYELTPGVIPFAEVSSNKLAGAWSATPTAEAQRVAPALNSPANPPGRSGWVIWSRSTAIQRCPR
ncbi:MAG: outer membrane beta-barrel protein [Xanthobacteraceae bacterium]